MAKAKMRTMYVCSECGEESISWQGRCPVCGQWNTFSEFKTEAVSSSQRAGGVALELSPLDISATLAAGDRLATGFVECDRVLGGGLLQGSVILLGGEPGIGKSTLLLQVAQHVAEHHEVIYFSGEESAMQVAGRAKRLGITPSFLFANETRLSTIRETLLNKKPKLVIVDSVQTLYDDQLPSTPGSLVQVRECSLQLQELAKAHGITLILVGHITKEGTVAGPKTLEHMVDVVLYLEGESRSEMRILRSMKNRFGATYEVGLFELSDRGLTDINDPTQLFIEQHSESVPGSALTAVLEGMRPIIVEVQALVVPTAFGYPKRTASGIDLQRLHILLAILESRVQCTLSSHDVFVNVVGGYRVTDRGADLAACMALLSAASNAVLPDKQVFYGEVGLTGEIRSVVQQKRRDEEVKRLGYLATPGYGTLKQAAENLALRQPKFSRRRPQ